MTDDVQNRISSIFVRYDAAKKEGEAFSHALYGRVIMGISLEKPVGILDTSTGDKKQVVELGTDMLGDLFIAGTGIEAIGNAIDQLSAMAKKEITEVLTKRGEPLK